MALVCGIDRADNLVSDGAAVLELVAEVSEGGLELHLCGGNMFADHIGCGVVVIDQVDPESQEGQSFALTSACLETLKSFDGASVDLGEGAAGHSMGGRLRRRSGPSGRLRDPVDRDDTGGLGDPVGLGGLGAPGGTERQSWSRAHRGSCRPRVGLRDSPSGL